MLFAPLILKEPFRARDLAMLLVCAGGMTLFFFDDLSPGQRDGNLLAMVSGVGFAFVILGMRWGRPKDLPEAPAGPEGELPREAIPVRGGIAQLPTPNASSKKGPNESEQLAVYGNLVCFLLCAPMLRMPEAPHPELFLGGLAQPLAVLLFMGIVQLGLGYYLLARGIKHVPAVEASLLVLIEPVLNPVWTYLVSGERPSAWALAGGSVIIGTVAVQALRGSK
ncbi:MAG: DMT family transporter [Planctomycetota bacterium]|nr:DMT family transporter [Planctomycetota bacterium]